MVSRRLLEKRLVAYSRLQVKFREAEREAREIRVQFPSADALELCMLRTMELAAGSAASSTLDLIDFTRRRMEQAE